MKSDCQKLISAIREIQGFFKRYEELAFIQSSDIAIAKNIKEKILEIISHSNPAEQWRQVELKETIDVDYRGMENLRQYGKEPFQLIAGSRDGSRVAVKRDAKTITIYGSEGEETKYNLTVTGHTKYLVEKMAFSRDGYSLVTVAVFRDKNGPVNYSQPERKIDLYVLNQPDSHHLSESKDVLGLAYAPRGGLIRLYSDGRLMQSVDMLTRFKSVVDFKAIEVSRSNNYVLIQQDDKIRVYDRLKKKETQYYSDAKTFALNPARDELVLSSTDGEIWITNFPDGKNSPRLVKNGSFSTALAFDPSGQNLFIASSGIRKRIDVYNLSLRKVVARIDLPTAEPIRELVVSKDGKIYLSYGEKLKEKISIFSTKKRNGSK